MGPFKVSFMAILLTWQATTALAEKTTCKRGGFAREIEVIYNPQEDVACEVKYRKKDLHPKRKHTLWQAHYDASFCQEKATELIARLESWQWVCANKQMAKAKNNKKKARM